jgi:uncharacterized protein YqgC (DUF456 family)
MISSGVVMLVVLILSAVAAIATEYMLRMRAMNATLPYSRKVGSLIGFVVGVIVFIILCALVIALKLI